MRKYKAETWVEILQSRAKASPVSDTWEGRHPLAILADALAYVKAIDDTKGYGLFMRPRLVWTRPKVRYSNET